MKAGVIIGIAPRLKTMWAGYAFSKDFREERGHAYMLDDQTFTERQKVTHQPGTCINCHASVRKSGWSIRGPKGSRLRTFSRFMTNRSSKTGNME